MSELISNDGGTVFALINDSVLEVLEEHRQLAFNQPESGGILIGEYRGPHLNIVKLTTPADGDLQSRFRFFRRSKSHQFIASKTWEDSNSTQTFLGDWHTHAEDHPSPSSIDTSDWLRKLPNRKIIVIIQGRLSRWYGLWDGKYLREASVVDS
jgi:integrative and conjugative element protein (TIGR02256 family)